MEDLYNFESAFSSWTNYANNAECVKQTITNEYFHTLKMAGGAALLGAGSVILGMLTYLF